MNNGGSAFPYSALNPEGPMVYKDSEGMSLRDYFAAKAMATFLEGAVLPTKESRDEMLPLVASVAYEAADAMLKARDA